MPPSPLSRRERGRASPPPDRSIPPPLSLGPRPQPVRGKGRIFSHSHVTGIEEGGHPIVIHTQNGSTVRAKNVVTATNAPINDNVAIYSKQAPYRSYVVGLAIDADSLPKALYWDTLDPYH